ncbi:MAG: transcriptional regulator [Nitrosopumilales archaeon CG_4_9_14_0_2_um_filter_34_16]|nr:MAG: transcriptional regulator [Nitrosopumilales archaeon CG_4_9_14_0_2_um_filter_34_16]
MAKAYVLMNCDLGSEIDVISSLKKIDGIKEAHGTLGLYDIVAKIELESEEKVMKMVTGVIRKMPKIHSTLTLTRSESQELFLPSENLVGMILGQNIAQAYVVIHCKKGEEYPTLKNLSHIPEVKEADVVFGFYDVICKIQASDNKTLENIITKAVRALPHIESSMTLNIINEQEQDIEKTQDRHLMAN